MAITNKTYQPVQNLTVLASADLTAFRFISYSGGLSANETRAFGVADQDWLSGEYASVISLGTAIIETDSAISAGGDVTASTNGKAKAASGSMPVNGRAIDSCSGAGFIRIKVLP